MANPNVPDLCGQRFGRIYVISREGSDKKGNSRWNCVCDCGQKRVVLAQSLRSGGTKSCGCLNKEIVSKMTRRHGRSKTSDYKAWHMMTQRCTKPKNPKWERYGARGISVCERWMTFENFIEDMGERPPGMTIDRIDNDGNYEPGNCRWATQMTQGSNRSNNRLVQIDKAEMTISQASRKYEINLSTVRRRLMDGWGMEEALKTKPHQPRGSH